MAQKVEMFRKPDFLSMINRPVGNRRASWEQYSNFAFLLNAWAKIRISKSMCTLRCDMEIFSIKR